MNFEKKIFDMEKVKKMHSIDQDVMHIKTGCVDTWENWLEDIASYSDIEHLIAVEKNVEGDWIEQD